MNKKEEKEARNKRFLVALEDQPEQNPHKYPMSKFDAILPPLERRSYEDIVSTLRIDIPKCDSQPVNGRIYVIEKAGNETKTASGIIIERRLNIRKDDAALSAKRYFVVAWDDKGIPADISERLMVGIEINPFLPQEAEEWSLPRVIDWSTGNEFLSVHYTELAGISKIKPQKDE